MSNAFSSYTFNLLPIFENDLTKSGWILTSEIDDADGEFAIDVLDILQEGEVISLHGLIDIAKDNDALCSQRHIESILRKQEDLSVQERLKLLPAECQECCSIAAGTILVDSKNRPFMSYIAWCPSEWLESKSKWEMRFY